MDLIVFHFYQTLQRKHNHVANLQECY